MQPSHFHHHSTTPLQHLAALTFALVWGSGDLGLFGERLSAGTSGGDSAGGSGVFALGRPRRLFGKRAQTPDRGVKILLVHVDAPRLQDAEEAAAALFGVVDPDPLPPGLDGDLDVHRLDGLVQFGLYGRLVTYLCIYSGWVGGGKRERRESGSYLRRC